MAVLLSSAAFGAVSGNLTIERGVIYPGEQTRLKLSLFNHGFSPVGADAALLIPPDLGASHNFSLGKLSPRSLTVKEFGLTSVSTIAQGGYVAFLTVKTANATLLLSATVSVEDWPLDVKMLIPVSSENITLEVANKGGKVLQDVNMTVTMPAGSEPRQLSASFPLLPPGHSEKKHFALKSVVGAGSSLVEAEFFDLNGYHSYSLSRPVEAAGEQLLPQFRFNEVVIILIAVIIIILIGRTVLT
ncbi:hypothetical protein HY546_01840 [archaeon]|nr:hypothetical protein [archaeon]